MFEKRPQGKDSLIHLTQSMHAQKIMLRNIIDISLIQKTAMKFTGRHLHTVRWQSIPDERGEMLF